MERSRHFEDFVVGESRTTNGRTITETDFVIHAGVRSCLPNSPRVDPKFATASARTSIDWRNKVIRCQIVLAGSDSPRDKTPGDLAERDAAQAAQRVRFDCHAHI